jgi:hypothetical protein
VVLQGAGTKREIIVAVWVKKVGGIPTSAVCSTAENEIYFLALWSQIEDNFFD